MRYCGPCCAEAWRKCYKQKVTITSGVEGSYEAPHVWADVEVALLPCGRGVRIKPKGLGGNAKEN